MVAEVRGEAPGAPVDTTGDRPGINAGDPIPKDEAPGSGARSVDDGPTSAEIRARFEAEENERHPDDEPPEERTHVFAAPRPSRRVTLLGGLAGAPLERPTSSATRAAEAFRRSHPALPLPSLDTEGPGINRGELPGHCNRRPDCQYAAVDIEPTPAGIDPRDWRSVGACTCTCEACGATEAERESHPPSSGRRSRPASS
jgi:hypothetical protein